MSPISAMAAILPLSLFWVSVSPAAAELEPLEDGCFLQKTKEQQLLVKEEQLRVTPDYVKVCGPNCRCTPYADQLTGPSTLQDCADEVWTSSGGTASGFVFTPVLNPFLAPFPVCRRCVSMNQETNIGEPFSLYAFEIGAMATGDPHITTLDGMSYTLLSQGTFSLWHFSGLETESPSEGGTAKKLPVDWQAFVHYSGQQSFIKGLLLVDKSGGSIRQVLEITSRDCKWYARKGNEDWNVVNNAEHIFVPDGKDYMTGFDLNTVTRPRGHGGHGFPNRVRFNVNTKNGKLDVAIMSLSCKPRHNMDLQFSMTRQSDLKFVEGELKAARKKLSTLQTSTDSEFRVESSWQQLGGSQQAAMYFQHVDTNHTSAALLQSQGCSDAEKSRAEDTCSKHLGEARGTQFFEDCVFDVCHGAGETQAELAAELLSVTKAD